MPYLVVESLKHGLDVRKSVLTSIPGTLEIAENGHINEGGEFQKRKAFVTSNNDFPANTFGLQPSDSGLQRYGSISTPANLPAGVIYVRLQHPTVLAGGVYNATYHAMTAVVMSDNFNGKAFVVAQFADGRRFLYYDGDIVLDSANGLVMEGATSVAGLATALGINVASIPNWFVEVNQTADGSALNGCDIVFSPPGVSFAPTIEVASTIGRLSDTNATSNDDGTAYVRARVFFVLSGVPGVGNVVTISGPTTPTSGDSNVLGTITVGGVMTLDHLGDLLATAINNDLLGLGYVATYDSVTNNIAIFAPLSWIGAQANGVPVVVTYTGIGVAAGTAYHGVISATLSTYNIYFTQPNPARIPYTVVSTAVTCTAQGGTDAGFTYVWSRVSGTAMTITNPSGPSTAFSYGLAPGQTAFATFKCTVDDGAGNGPVDSGYITVSLILP